MSSIKTGQLRKRSLRLAGHRTSLALEPPFWAKVEEMARAAKQTVPVFIAAVDAAKPADASLASHVRVVALLGGLQQATP